MTIPVPPALPSQHNRYSTSLVRLAIAMYGDGDAWTPTQIHRYLAEHVTDGPVPSVKTIRRWVIPAFAEEIREQNRRHTIAHRQRRRGQAQAPMAEPLARIEPLSKRELDDRMLELRRRGMTYTAISIALDVYHGVAMTEDTVRRRLRQRGVQPNPARVRAAQALRAAQTARVGTATS